VLVVKKPRGSLKIYINYYALNNITKKNYNTPPTIKETFTYIAKVKIISIINIIAIFNTIYVK